MDTDTGETGNVHSKQFTYNRSAYSLAMPTVISYQTALEATLLLEREYNTSALRSDGFNRI